MVGWFPPTTLAPLNQVIRGRVGRADEAISTGGFTVPRSSGGRWYPPAVRDCAVFTADDRLGQRVVAAIVVGDGCPPPTLEALRAHVARTLERRNTCRERATATRHRQGGPNALVRRFARPINRLIGRGSVAARLAVAIRVCPGRRRVRTAAVEPQNQTRSDIGLERFATRAGARRSSATGTPMLAAGLAPAVCRSGRCGVGAIGGATGSPWRIAG